MVTASKDLWGSLNFANFEATPVTLLKEQAALLGEKTNNLFRGEVISRDFANSSGKGKMLHLFNVVVPGLKNRRVELFRSVHDLNAYFPIEVLKNDGQKKGVRVDNLDQFEQQISRILSDDWTKQQLQDLLSELNTRKVAVRK
ncbi:MAG: hypothetical protein IT258_21605 [Saprospiraceae bacterium]|nr:hypothetical protein [Saprospiraceae bacterium]